MTNHHFPRRIKILLILVLRGEIQNLPVRYTFQFIQKNSEQITEALIKTGRPFVNRSVIKKRFDLYDATLLNILHHDRLFRLRHLHYFNGAQHNEPGI